MLKLGGYINIIISVAHVLGLIWINEMFTVTGIEKEMDQLNQIHVTLPYLLTLIVAIIFFIFGLYGLSAANKFRKLPLLKLGVFSIALIYIFRGVGELLHNLLTPVSYPLLEMVYSIIALGIGLLFLFGGLKKWKNKSLAV